MNLYHEQDIVTHCETQRIRVEESVQSSKERNVVTTLCVAAMALGIASHVCLRRGHLHYLFNGARQDRSWLEILGTVVPCTKPSGTKWNDGAPGAFHSPIADSHRPLPQLSSTFPADWYEGRSSLQSLESLDNWAAVARKRRMVAVMIADNGQSARRTRSME